VNRRRRCANFFDRRGGHHRRRCFDVLDRGRRSDFDMNRRFVNRGRDMRDRLFASDLTH
jgi:hypothetical protein